MKKLLAVLIVLSMVLSTMPAFAENYTMQEDYVFHNLLPKDSIANYSQFYEDQNVTRYTPWIRYWHMETQEKYDRALEEAESENMGSYGGEAGQVVMSLAVSPVNPDNVLAGTDIAGGWVSHNGGEHWTVIDGVFTQSVPDAIWHPTDGKVAYMLQVEKDDYEKQPKTQLDGLYKSIDAGLTWQQISDKTFVTDGNKSENLLDFDDYGNLYYLSSEGIFKVDKDDNTNQTCLGKLVGETYVPASNSETADVTKDIYSMYVSGDGQTIAVAIYNGLYKTTDSGASWTKLTPGNNVDANAACYSITVDPTNSYHWVSVWPKSTSNPNGIALNSTDSGSNWSSISLSGANVTGDRHTAFAKFGPVAANGKPKLYMIFANMNSPYRYLSDGTQVSSSSNSWTEATFKNHEDRFLYKADGYTSEGLAICDRYPDIVYYSFGDIIYKSTDGGVTFEPKSAGYSAVLTRQFYFDESGKIWMPIQDKGLAVTNSKYTADMYDENKLPTVTLMNPGGDSGNDGKHYTSVSVVADPADPNHIFASFGGWTSQKLYVTTDGGSSWTEVSVNYGTDSEGNALTEANWAILKYINDTTIVSNEFISKDNGSTWTRIQKDETNLTLLAVNNTYPNIWYANQPDKKIIRTTDMGTTWTDAHQVTNNSAIVTVLPDISNPNVCWIGAANGNIFKATYKDDGTFESYQAKSNGIPYLGTSYFVRIQAIAQNPNNPLHMVAGGKGQNAGSRSYGLIESYDGGENWHVVKGFRGIMTVNNLKFSPVTSEIFIGSGSNGTLVYDYSKYSPTNNSVNFDLNGINAEAPTALTGNYGDMAVLPDVTTDETVLFKGWKQEYTTYSLYGTPTTVSKTYAPGESIMVEHTDITLKAEYEDLTGTIFKDENGEIEELKADKITATREMVGEGKAIPILGLYDLTTGKLVKLVKGDTPVTLNQTTPTPVELEIDLTGEDISNKVLKYFIWDSLTNAFPLVKWTALQ